MAIQHRIFHIQGRVQGVFFRESARQQAQQLSLTGYARNNPNGTVTIEAEGTPEALDTLQAWCQHGPSAAHVAHVEAATGGLQHYRAFEIQR